MAMAEIIAGRALAAPLLARIKKQLASKHARLSIVQVGDNPASLKFVQEKEKACRDAGIEFERVALPTNVSQENVENTIRSLAKNPKVSGIVVQLPLPKALDTETILSLVPFQKDPDVLSSAAFQRFALGTYSVLPPTVAAVSYILKSKRVEFLQKDVLIVGMGRLVGLPLSLWFLRQGARVSVATSKTKNIAELSKKADIIISGVGKPGIVTGDMIKRGAFVIDAGTSVEAGQSKGDVDVESVAKKAVFLAPVPGGVGPLTVACLLSNLIELSNVS